MPQANICRVRTVRLQAPDAALVRRGAMLLEDALHTATVPGTTRGRLLCIRSLAVGVIRPRQSAASIALRIEQALQHLQAQAVHAMAPDAAHQPAVYFRDEVEPYVLLALHLARGQRPTAWFWPRAVPRWQPGLLPAAALRRVVTGAIYTRPGVAALLRVLHALHTQALIEPLCEALRPSDGPALLHLCGWQQPSESPSVSVQGAIVVSPGWENLLRQWTQHWGHTDARALWLASVGAAMYQPARLLDPHMLPKARQVLVNIVRSSGPAARSMRDVSAAVERQVTPPVARSHPPSIAVSTFRTPDAQSRQSARPYDVVRRSAPPPVHTDAEDKSEIAETLPVDGSAEGQTELRVPLSNTLEDTSARVDAFAQGVGTTQDIRPMPESWPHSTAEPGEQQPEPLSYWPTEPVSTPYAGLFFLVPLLTRLGMASFLTAHPHWIDHDVPWQLLRAVCTGLDVPHDDPVLAVCDLYTEAETGMFLGFVVPDQWQQTILQSAPWTIRRVVAGGAHARLMYDGSGRLPIALWSGRSPQTVRCLLGDQPCHRGATITDLCALDLVLKAWRLAMRRWCRRHAGLGLADLVRRPGFIMASRTHVDVFFRHADTDVRVRRAGLDLDPGWVAWLGRVVTFHYSHGEQFHA